MDSDIVKSFGFVVEGKPQPKQRPRVTKRGTFTPKATKHYEARVAIAARDAWGDGPTIIGAVRVDLLIVLKRPGRLHARKHPDGFRWAPVRPDSDNIRKSVLDGLCGPLGVIDDDGQVVAGETLKVYGDRGEEPRVVVLVTVLQSMPGMGSGYWDKWRACRG